MLRSGAAEIITENDTVTGIIDESKQTLKAPVVICGAPYAKRLGFAAKVNKLISRCVVVTNNSLTAESRQIVGVIPPNTINNKNSIKIFQFDHEMSIASKGKCNTFYILTLFRFGSFSHRRH